MDVIPAVRSAPKKHTPNTALSAGSVLIAVGNVMKASPIPEPAISETSTPCCRAMNPMMLNTPIPAKISKPWFAVAVINGMLRVLAMVTLSSLSAPLNEILIHLLTQVFAAVKANYAKGSNGLFRVVLILSFEHQIISLLVVSYCF